MSSSNCCFLTYIQVSQEEGQVVWYSQLFQNFQFIVTHIVKGFGIVNKSEIDVFLELSCFFHDPADVGNLISGSSAFSQTSLNIWKFMVHLLLKPGLENFDHYFTSMWDECNCVFPGAWNGEEAACNAGESGSIPGLERSPEEGNGNPLQYSGLENSMDCIVYGVPKSLTWLSDFHFTHTLVK